MISLTPSDKMLHEMDTADMHSKLAKLYELDGFIRAGSTEMESIN
jgi:hypothetical protein